jgi:hypothetical protein
MESRQRRAGRQVAGPVLEHRGPAEAMQVRFQETL